MKGTKMLNDKNYIYGIGYAEKEKAFIGDVNGHSTNMLYCQHIIFRKMVANVTFSQTEVTWVPTEPEINFKKFQTVYR